MKATPFAWRDPSTIPRRPKVGGPIIHDCNEVYHRGEDLDPIIWQGRTWCVTSYGVEKRDGTYAIAAADVVDEGARGYFRMVCHMYQKKDVDIDNLRTALLILCVLHGVEVPAEVVLARVQPFDRRFMELLPTS